MLYDILRNITNGNAALVRGIEVLSVTLLVFLLTVLITRTVLPVLRAKKLGQNISEYVKEHGNKQGTPTMGGICFIMAFLLVMIFFVVLEVMGVIGARDDKALITLALTVCLGVANGMIGFVDDYAKLVKKQNEGLTPIQKSALQFIVAGAYIAVMAFSENLTTAFRIPFTSYSLELGFFAYPIYLLVIVGFINATNITDGLDGLASSVTVSVSGTVILLSCVLGWRYTGVVSGALLGAALGFLVFNHYPAKIFMGDTGSLFIGGVIMGCACAQGELLSFIIMGFLFVSEMLSSLLQTTYFKLTHGKRLFKMAPVHHHFQKMGWSEIKIVTVFFIVSLVLCAIGYAGCIIY